MDYLTTNEGNVGGRPDKTSTGAAPVSSTTTTTTTTTTPAASNPKLQAAADPALATDRSTGIGSPGISGTPKAAATPAATTPAPTATNTPAATGAGTGTGAGAGAGTGAATTTDADLAANNIAARAATAAAQSNGYYDDKGKYHTTIYGADGNKYSGYIYNGATYYDNGDRLADGDSVIGADGQRYTMDRSTKSNVNPNLSNALSDEFQDWLYSENAGKSAFSIKNDYEGFLPQYRTDKYGQDVSNGAVTMWPDGSIMVSDGFQNVVGRFDSAGTWHPANEGHEGQSGYGNNALYDSWEQTARKALEEAGHKFTGNGLEWNARKYETADAGEGASSSIPKLTSSAVRDHAGGYGAYSSGGASYSGSYGSSGGGTSNAPVSYGTGTGAPTQSSGISPEVAQLLSGLNNTPTAASSSGIDIQPYLDAIMSGQNTTTAPTPSGIDVKPYLDALMSGQSDPKDIQYYLDQIKAQNPQDASAIDAYVAAALETGKVNVPEAPDLKPLLDEWRTAAEEQQRNSIDYATNQGITNLQRAEEDAQQGFRTAQEQITADEMRSRDNQALYAEARGDKGGIGAAQYDAIGNTAAINRQNVRDSQMKLSTDTARQIEDLRNQGEFKKADAVLQISQEYLSNLMSLEQWAANYGLSAAQFEEAIREWENNFKLNVANITGELNGVQTLAARNADREMAMNLMNYDLNKSNADRDYAMNLMNYDLNRTNADRNYELNKTNSDRDYMMNLVNYDLNRTNADRNYDLNALNSNRDWAMNLLNYDLNKTNADRNFGLNEAGVTGYYGGRATLEKTNADRNFGLNEANVTGYYNGSPTMAKTNSDRNYELEKTNADRNFALNEANVTGTYNGAPTYAATKQNTSNLSSIGMSMLQAGIMPSTEMLRAMGIGEADAQAYLMGLQTAAAAKKTGGGGGGGNVVTDNTAAYAALFEAARNADNPYEYLAKNAKTFGLSVNDNLWNNYTQWENSPTGGQYINPANIGDTASAWLGRFKNGTGSWNDTQKIGNKIQELADQGKITAEEGVWIGRELGLW